VAKPLKKTIDLCLYQYDDGPCTSKVLWKLKAERTGRCFKVCDSHLAWGIRMSGTPAYVEEFLKPPTTPEY